MFVEQWWSLTSDLLEFRLRGSTFAPSADAFAGKESLGVWDFQVQVHKLRSIYLDICVA
jgi:hypothetical protein